MRVSEVWGFLNELGSLELELTWSFAVSSIPSFLLRILLVIAVEGISSS